MEISRFKESGPVWPTSSISLSGAQGGNPASESLGSSTPGPPGNGSYRQHYGSVLYQQARGNISLRLIADLFLWFYSKDIVPGLDTFQDVSL